MRVFFLAFLHIAFASSASSVSAQSDTVDLAVLNDKTTRIVAPRPWKCSVHIPMTIISNDASFFEQRINDLGTLYGAAAQKIVGNCDTLQRISISGVTADVEIISGEAKKTEGWTLRLGQPNLSKDAAKITQAINSFGDLENMLDVFSPYRYVPGINRTSGYVAFANASRTAVQSLLSKDENFEQFVIDTVLHLDNDDASTEIQTALSIVRLYAPQKADHYARNVEHFKVRALRSAALEAAKEAIDGEDKIEARVSALHAHLAKRPPDPETILKIDSNLSSWFENTISAHEENNAGGYLNNVRAHIQLVESLGSPEVTTHLPEAQAAIETARYWFEALSEELLAEIYSDASAIIADTGASYRDVDLILETGLALHQEFQAHGFQQEANEILDLATSRIEQVISDGLDGYAEQIRSENMTLDKVTLYKQEAEVLYELSQDYPGFAEYVAAAEEGIELGQLQACAVVASEVETRSNRAATFLIGDRSLSLKSLACALYTNGHLLSEVLVERNQDGGSLTLLEANTNELTFEFVSSEDGSYFWGVDDAWEQELGRLVIPPPSGKPDRNGVTECDMLAGDPHDKTLPVDGVTLEEVGFEYDFDRAIEACIAAVEYNPDATRQVYQLARILEFLGDVESAAQYTEVAAQRKYAPAIHLQAFSILTYRDDDDAFFDAVDLLKVSSGLGYAPSRAELNELVPPGSNFYREIPPPSDTEIMKLIPDRECAGVQGFSQSCTSMTGVYSKSCFQISANEFSCELRFNRTCDHRGNPLIALFGEMAGSNLCPPVTNTVFLNFTKKDNFWSYKKAF